jgi:hypothetical protein
MKLRVLAIAQLFLVVTTLRGQESNVVARAQDSQQIPGPRCYFVPDWNTPRASLCTPAETAAWLADIKHWRAEERLRMGYDASQYVRPELLWTQTSFIQPQMMVHDRYFYDPVAQKYTVDRYLDDVDARYGGIDSVLVWHTYPNLGIDDRNQFDLFRDLPGGVPGVRAMIERFHQRGVRVLFPVMMWDQGTHDEGVTRKRSLKNSPAWVPMASTATPCWASPVLSASRPTRPAILSRWSRKSRRSAMRCWSTTTWAGERIGNTIFCLR